jgi:glutamate carboxypeptidase
VLDGPVLHGPGTYDMKAGVVQALTALDLVAAVGQTPSVAPVVLLNSDEEIGSRESTPAIRALSEHADRVLVLEPSLGRDGALKTARKGLGRYTVTVHGKAAHAGLDPTAGASAILELSAVIQALFALNDHERGVTVNVGMVSGGIQPNVIAPESSAVIDVRVLTAADASMIDQRIRSLTTTTPGTSLTIEGGMGRPPLERTARNAALLDAALRVAADMGLDLPEATAGGGSDGNTASQVAPTLDGLGAVGDGAHADHEQVYVPGWVDRTALLAALLLLPPVRYVPDHADAVDPLSLVPEP